MTDQHEWVQRLSDQDLRELSARGAGDFSASGIVAACYLMFGGLVLVGLPVQHLLRVSAARDIALWCVFAALCIPAAVKFHRDKHKVDLRKACLLELERRRPR